MQGVADSYKHGSSSFFAMYRFDFMLDQQLRPYIMEVSYMVPCIIRMNNAMKALLLLMLLLLPLPLLLLQPDVFICCAYQTLSSMA